MEEQKRENERYYWLKLKKDFFKRHDVKIIEGMENGKDYVLFYLKLLCESLDHNGNLRFSDTIPYNESMLASITGTNIDVVRSAMKVLVGLNLIEIFDDQTIFMREVEKMTGSETASTIRSRECRLRQNEARLLQCNTNATNSNAVATQENRDKSIESISNIYIVGQPDGKRSFLSEIKEIVAYLNEKIGTVYKPDCKNTQTCIKARLNEGFTVDDFKKVIDKKSAEWLHNSEMAKFLRPQTLFSPKFESYLNEPVATSSGQAKQTSGWLGTTGEIDYGED